MAEKARMIDQSFRMLEVYLDGDSGVARDASCPDSVRPWINLDLSDRDQNDKCGILIDCNCENSSGVLLNTGIWINTYSDIYPLTGSSGEFSGIHSVSTGEGDAMSLFHIAAARRSGWAKPRDTAPGYLIESRYDVGGGIQITTDENRLDSFVITAASRDGAGVVTLTCGTHTFRVGDYPIVSGVTDASFDSNVAGVVTAVTSTTITYATATLSAASSSGGYVRSAAANASLSIRSHSRHLGARGFVHFWSSLGEAAAYSGGSGDIDNGSINISGSYTGTPEATAFKLVCDGVGTPNTFALYRDNILISSGNSVSTTPVSVGLGVSVSWNHNTGHTIGGTWTFEALRAPSDMYSIFITEDTFQSNVFSVTLRDGNTIIGGLLSIGYLSNGGGHASHFFVDENNNLSIHNQAFDRCFTLVTEGASLGRIICHGDLVFGTGGFEGQVNPSGITASRGWLLPDQDGTFAMLSDVTAATFDPSASLQWNNGFGVVFTMSSGAAGYLAGSATTMAMRMGVGGFFLLSSSDVQRLQLTDGGDLILSSDLKFQSGTSYVGQLSHNNTANRVYSFGNLSGDVALITGIAGIVGEVPGRVLTVSDASGNTYKVFVV